MIDPLTLVLGTQPLSASLVAPNSRYASVGVETLSLPDGTTIAYFKRRFVPFAGSLAVFQTHTVTQGDRLDNIAFAFLADPTLFWRICDANDALEPDELTSTIGVKLAIALPSAMTGTIGA